MLYPLHNLIIIIIIISCEVVECSVPNAKVRELQCSGTVAGGGGNCPLNFSLLENLILVKKLS